MSYQDYQDQFGFLHNVPHPKVDETENPLTFTGTYFILKDPERTDAVTLRHLNAHVCRDGEYRTTPLTAWGKSISHDDATAWLSALWKNGLMDEVKRFKMKFPRHFAPWNWAYYCTLKKGINARRIPLITRMAGELSCEQGHKIRGGAPIAKTDGKILALLRARTLRDWRHEQAITELVKTSWHEAPLPRHASGVVLVNQLEKRWCWDNWHNVFLDYYQMDYNHPNVKLAERWRG